MPVDRELLSAYLTKSGAPNWACPRCRGGHYRLVPDSLFHSWTADTQEASSHEAFEASWVNLRFVAVLKCDNQKCGEVATVAGTGKVDEYPDEHLTEMLYEEVLNPTYFSPSPTLIAIPSNCPVKVVNELTQAFVAIWGDYSSAGNRVRAAVERLLDALRVPKQTTNTKGRRQPIGLHARFGKIKEKYPEVHDSLLAIKWLGNAGSHTDALKRDDVCDALDIFESVLAILYSRRPSAIRRLVKTVNARKGPTRRGR
jgi:hypothetical protein